MDHVYRLGRQVRELKLGEFPQAADVHDAAMNFINLFTDWYDSSEARHSLGAVYRMAQMDVTEVSVWMETARQN